MGQKRGAGVGAHAGQLVRVAAAPADGLGQGNRVLRRYHHAAAVLARDPRRFGVRFHRSDERPSRRHDPIDLARHDAAGHAALKGHKVNVGRAKRFAQGLFGLIRQEGNVPKVFLGDESPESALIRALADEQKADIGLIPQQGGGLDHLVQPLGEAEIAGVHHEEVAIEAVLRAETGRVRFRSHSAAVRPVRDNVNETLGDPLGNQASLHVLAQRHHPIRMSEDDRVGLPQREDHERIGQAPRGEPDIRVQVLAVIHKAAAVPILEEDAEQPGNRRIRLGDNNVRPLHQEAGKKGPCKVRGEIDAALDQPPLIEDGVADAQDADKPPPGPNLLLPDRPRQNPFAGMV